MDTDSMKEEIEMETTKPAHGAFAQWRLNGIGLLRILCGIVWGIDAWFKWQPDFVNNFTTYLTGAQADQPGRSTTGSSSGSTLSESTLRSSLTQPPLARQRSRSLIVGAFTNLTSLVGVLLSVVIWSTAEGFGGPYHAGSTDVGAAIIYPLVFAGLFLNSAGLHYGIDRKLTPALGRFGYLGSGWLVKRSSTAAMVKPLATQ